MTMTEASLGLLIGVLALGPLYFLPTIVALDRRHQQRWPIVILNALLGWTLIGWIVALAWSASHQPSGTLQLRREWKAQ
ncbi:MAG TPA: superinfection immunity protein [Xanthobacteraceae bacterium]|nr:superinfection immunity protein [Xanthobacteraceae bacterium]